MSPAFEVHKNGTRICTAALGAHGTTAVFFALTMTRPGVGGFHVTGYRLESKEQLTWIESDQIHVGDTLTVRLVDVEESDAPKVLMPSDDDGGQVRHSIAFALEESRDDTNRK
jgi:hypothetical protein